MTPGVTVTAVTTVTRKRHIPPKWVAQCSRRPVPGYARNSARGDVSESGYSGYGGYRYTKGADA
jgi:hypothetical protein